MLALALCAGAQSEAVRHSIRFVENADEVLVTTSGEVSLDGLDAIVTDLLADPRYHPGMTVVFDHSHLDWQTLYADDLVRRLHLALKEADLIGPRRIAVVTQDPRIGEATVVRSNDPVWQAFETLGDARVWLEGH